MNELLIFIKEHPHCTQLFCTTCGGLSAFRYELNQWINNFPIDLVNHLRKIQPNELLDIDSWQIYLDQIMQLVPENQRFNTVYPDWFSNLNKNFLYDFFALRFAPIWFFQKAQNEIWINEIIDTAIGKHMDREIQGLIHHLGKETHRFQNLVAYQEYKEWQYQRGKEEARIREGKIKEEERIRAERVKEERSRIQAIFVELSEMDEKTRLINILKDQTINIYWLPKEWASISDELFREMNSKELTQLIKLLSGKLRKSCKCVWRDLRSQLYRLRQSVYNQEQGFSRIIK